MWGRSFNAAAKWKSLSAGDLNTMCTMGGRNGDCRCGSVDMCGGGGDADGVSLLVGRTPCNLAYALEMYYTLFTMG